MAKARMIRIYGVSLKQQRMLDKIWSFDTEEELMGWMKSLNKKKLKKVCILKEIIELAAIDEYVLTMEDYPHAQDIIDNIISVN